MDHHEFDYGPEYAQGGSGSPPRGDGQPRTEGYDTIQGMLCRWWLVDSEEAKALNSLGPNLETALIPALNTGDLERVLSLTASKDFNESFKKIFATRREDYEVPYGEDDKDLRYITHYALSETVRRAALDLCIRLPPKIADTVVDEIMSLPFEDHPTHKVGYSRKEKLKIIQAMAEKGSQKAKSQIAKLFW